jgi:glutamyl-tRNA reductase
VLDFSVAQQPSGSGAWPDSAVVWRTCVREIALVDSRTPVPSGARVWHDEAAYAHLLEVICGLDSPMIGETEVLHQFKVFTAGLSLEQGAWREVAQSLMNDARTIRSRHLIGLGSRSYGSAVRRLVGSTRRVVLVGTGMLAKELAPFLVGAERTVDLWGRRDHVDGFPGVMYRQLSAPPAAVVEEPVAMVIAAPLPSSDIARLAARYRNAIVLIDLRAEGVQDPPPAVAPVVTLADVFAGVQDAARTTEARVQAATDDIRRCARAFATRAKLNPSGWHDLCA